VHEFDVRMRCYLWNDIFDAHRDSGKPFVVRADEMLTAFLELQAAIYLRLSWKVMRSSMFC
jgi:hypothetical protein